MICSISANNAHTPFLPLPDIQQQPYAALEVVLPSKSFISSPYSSRFGISKLHFIHWPWRSLQSFVKQNTCPFVSQQERKEWSNTKPWRDLKGWLCSEAQAFWLAVQLCHNTENLTLLPHFNCHHLEKNAPHHTTLQINTSCKAVYFLVFEKLHPSSKTDFKKSSSSFVSQLQLRPLMVLMLKCCSCLLCCTALQMLGCLFARVVPLTHALQSWP